MTPSELHSLIVALGQGGQAKLARQIPCNARSLRYMLKGKKPILPRMAKRILQAAQECKRADKAGREGK